VGRSIGGSNEPGLAGVLQDRLKGRGAFLNGMEVLGIEVFNGAAVRVVGINAYIVLEVRNHVYNPLAFV